MRVYSGLALFVILSICVADDSDDTADIDPTDINNSTESNGTVCMLTQKGPSKPNPSLIQCYRNNPSSCCNSAADARIKAVYTTMLSAACIRQFPLLETYFCYSCSSQEYLYANFTTKELRICENFARSLWQSDLSKPTQYYDNCGMIAYWTYDSNVILPSNYFANATEFFANVKPPFYNDFSITIVSDNQNCFQSGSRLTVFLFTTLMLLIYLI